MEATEQDEFGSQIVQSIDLEMEVGNGLRQRPDDDSIGSGP